MQEIQDSVNIAEGFELLEATTTTLASEEALREKVKYDLDDGTEITQEAIVTVIDGRAFVALFRGQTEKYEEYREGFELIITSFALPGFKIEGGETE
jgi:hypothetical protein